MFKRISILAGFCILVILLFHSDASAQFTDLYGFFMSDINQDPDAVFCLDGAGGVIVAWSRTDSGAEDSNIYAQRIDDHGYRVWADGGVPICVSVDQQTHPQIVEDGSGGAIITWQDDRSGGYGVYGQRINSDGQWQWASNGIPVAWDAGTQSNHRSAADGFGGAVVVWEQYQIPYYQIRGQRVAPDGSLLWGSGTAIGTVAAHMRYPRLCVLPQPAESDVRVSVAWLDYRNSGTNGADIYMQRVTLSGLIQWSASGAPVYTGAADQIYPDLVPSNSSSTIIAWRDFRDGEDNGYVQKFDQYGNGMWTAGGILISSMEDADEGGPQVVGDGAGGVYATAGWNSNRFDSDGTWLWRRGVTTEYAQFAFNMRPILLDDGDFALVNHSHAGDAEPHEVRGRKLDRETGTNDLDEWNVYGEPLSVNAQFGQPFELLTTGSSLYALWDFSVWSWYFSLQRLDLDEAYWGYPRPVIVAADDVPADEGGWLRLRVRASTNDHGLVVDDVATGYNVWREITSAATKPVRESDDVLAAIGHGEDTGGLRADAEAALALGLPDGQWESVGFHAAMQEPYYDFLVPTRADSTGGSIESETFVVTVHTTSPTVHFTSETASGHSVDNLAPDMVLDLAGDAAYDPERLDLSWRASAASDLSHYAVHRDLTAGFTPSETNRVATTASSDWTDGDWTSAPGYVYKVAAVDRHGNVGVFAELTPGGITAIGAGGVPRSVSLTQNQPNPFNPSTTIRYTTAYSGHVELRVFDANGCDVRRLVDGPQAPGTYDVVWDGRDDLGRTVGSGVYFYRLVAGAERRTRSMILLK